MFARASYLTGLVPDWGDKLAGGFELYRPSPADNPQPLHFPGTNVPVKLTFPWSGSHNRWKDSWFPQFSLRGG